MPKLICSCPSCGGKLKIAALHCEGCGMELRNNFELNPFDLLEPEQHEFLISFLKQRGNLRSVQQEFNISYSSAKKRLDNLLITLNLMDEIPSITKYEEDIDMSNWFVPKDSSEASDIIKKKLMENNGKAVIYTFTNEPFEIRAATDGDSFLCDNLPNNPPYRYQVFDIIVKLLKSQGGRARKGNGRNYKLGEPKCDETTVVGAIGYRYWGKKTGESVLDPVFALAAVLEWAGIANNERGELVLTTDYMGRLQQ